MAADGELKFTEAQHLAILSDAVQRETAALVDARDGLEAQNRQLAEEVTTLSQSRDELAARVDVLEAEKAAEVQGRQNVETEFSAFKADLEAQREIALRKADRVAKLRAAAPHVPDEYFADEARQARWAEMAEDAFGVLCEDLTETARGLKPADDKGSPTADDIRQTAAFTGGTSPTGKDDGQVSTVRQLMVATKRLPAGI